MTGNWVFVLFFFHECCVFPVPTQRPPFKETQRFLITFLRTFLHAFIFPFPYGFKLCTKTKLLEMELWQMPIVYFYQYVFYSVPHLVDFVTAIDCLLPRQKTASQNNQSWTVVANFETALTQSTKRHNRFYTRDWLQQQLLAFIAQLLSYCWIQQRFERNF